MKIIAALFAVLTVASLASAKDRSDDYQMGSVMLMAGDSGWTDTTTCSGAPGLIHCRGGIIDDSPEDVYILTLTDGTEAVIRHVAFRADTIKAMNLENSKSVKTLYRIQRQHGLISIDYVMIPDPTNPKKEGWYYFAKSFKKPTAKPVAAPQPTNVSNLAAMCDSDKLAPELKAQYCAEVK